MTFVLLPCGCNIPLEHPTGDRLISCPGGGRMSPSTQVDRDLLVTCEGGKRYRASAYQVTRYQIQPWEAK
jgi:hypothetical protein